MKIEEIRPFDVFKKYLNLCSEDANFITGHGLVVDGGLSIQLQEDFGLRQAHYIRENPNTDINI